MIPSAQRDPGRTFDKYEITPFFGQTVISNLQDTFHHSCQKTGLWLLEISSLNGSAWPRPHPGLVQASRITFLYLQICPATVNSQQNSNKVCTEMCGQVSRSVLWSVSAYPLSQPDLQHLHPDQRLLWWPPPSQHSPPYSCPVLSVLWTLPSH